MYFFWLASFLPAPFAVLAFVGQAWEKLFYSATFFKLTCQNFLPGWRPVLLFGPIVGKQVLYKMTELLVWSSMHPTIATDVDHPSSSYDKASELVQKRLKQNVLVQKSLEPFKAISPAERTSTELIGELLNISYVEHERRERALRTDRRRRLSVGFKIVGELRYLLNSKRSLLNMSYIEAIDELLDTGAAVPQFVFDVPYDNEPGRWLRVYRYGENGYGTEGKENSVLYGMSCP